MAVRDRQGVGRAEEGGGGPVPGAAAFGVRLPEGLGDQGVVRGVGDAREVEALGGGGAGEERDEADRKGEAR